MSVPRTYPLLVLAALALASCAGEPPPPAETPLTDVAGECGDAFGGEVCTWATMEGDQVVAYGATVPLSSVEGAPVMTEMPAEIPWPPPTVLASTFPASATQQVGVNHLTVNWEPMGHAPVTYMTPHFDFHFYLVPSAQREAIDCSNTAKPSTLPAGYSLPDEQLPPEVAEMIGVEVLIGVCVPEMGMHALNAQEMQVETPFDGTMVVGYYETQPIFIEPMISRDFLLERQSFELPIPAIPGLEGSQPTSFRGDYDSATDAYRFTFSGFSSPD